jgi:CDP-diacylglycerol--glycerol-3-phosphate 3-phosphatidyltransferase
LRGIAVSQDIVIAASALGKYKTVFEVASIFFLIFKEEFLSIDFHQVGMVLLWVALVMAVLSGIDYFKKFINSITV